MATSTSNYRLTKPSPEDFYDIEVQNENLEVIDGKLKELETGVDQVREGFEGHLGDYVRNAGFGVTGGTLSAYTLTLNPSPNSYADGQQFTILPHVDCGANPKLNINGLGALTILKQDGSAVEAGEIKANKPLALVRVGSSFFMRSGGDIIIPVYSGNSILRIDSATKGQIVCTSSGNITWRNGKKPITIDIFVVGGGGSGGGTSAYNVGGGSGGGGGYYGKTLGVSAQDTIEVIVGAGGNLGYGGGQSSALGVSANGGGNGLYNSTTNRRAGGAGSAAGGSSGAVGESTGSPGADGVAIDFDGYTHAAGGGGGAGYNNSGGGAGGTVTNIYNQGFGLRGTINTTGSAGGFGGGGFGGGGGGACALNGNSPASGSGGSGVVIIRWGY